MKMVNEERKIRNSNSLMRKSHTGNMNRSLSKDSQKNELSDLSPASRHDKIVRKINLMKKHKQFNKEQYDHTAKSFLEQLREINTKAEVAEQNIKIIDDENEKLRV